MTGHPPTSKLMAKLRAERGGKRNRCPRTKNLEFAHVCPTKLVGRGRGSRDRYYDIRRNPHCYELLCRPCHRWMDFQRHVAA